MAFKVLHYNIREGGGGRLPAIASIIRRHSSVAAPDAVALLEANDRANAELLARDLDMHIAFGEANSPFHIAWLSRLPVLRRHNHRLPILAKTLLEIELPWEGTQGSEGPEPPALPLFATHLASRHDYRQPPDEA